EHGAAVLIKILTQIGDAETAGGAADQGHAQTRLKRAEPAADGRARQAKPPPRRREALLLHQHGKEGEVVEVHHGDCLKYRTLKWQSPVYADFHSGKRTIFSAGP